MSHIAGVSQGSADNVVITIIQPAATINFAFEVAPAAGTQFAPAAGTTAFVLPSVGTYLCTFFGALAGSDGLVAVKIIFDLGTPVVQSIGYPDTSWRSRCGNPPTYNYMRFAKRVAFVASGAHTLVCYGMQELGWGPGGVSVIGTGTAAVGSYTITLSKVS
jgi:hypothetical protein